MARPQDILIVDDEPNLRRTLQVHFESRGHRVQSAATLEEARRLISIRLFDLAFVDLRLGNDSGLDLIGPLRVQEPPAAVVVITAHASIDSAIAALKLGARDYLPKPFSPAELDLVAERLGAVDRIERRYRALARDVEEREPPVELASRSPLFARVLETLDRVSGSDVPVLVCGPNGAGKDVLARRIHDRSPRRDKPLVTVPCPALPRDLVESELFGHVRGSFTGAASDRQGRVAIAEGGTLVLDEIGDLPLPLQPKLLRFLQSREYEAVGDPRPRRADVRIVATTNRDLERAIADGGFREDLYYRLNVIRIDVPGLADRPEDILPLARGFLGFFARRYSRPELAFSSEAAAALQGHSWPGNVRELRNAVERAVLLATDGTIVPTQLGLQGSTGAAPSVALGARATLSEIEAEHLRRVLSWAKSYREAAEVLGIDEATLWRKRKQLDL